MCQLAAATGTHPHEWARTDVDVIVTMLDVLAERK